MQSKLALYLSVAVGKGARHKILPTSQLRAPPRRLPSLVPSHAGDLVGVVVGVDRLHLVGQGLRG